MSELRKGGVRVTSQERMAKAAAERSEFLLKQQREYDARVAAAREAKRKGKKT